MVPENQKGHLFIISGPSGAGKDSVLRQAAKKIQINLSVSITSRPKRTGEVSGKDYIFVSNKEFEELVKQGKLLEWAELYGHKYGTPKDYVVSQIKQGNDVYLEIDVQGAKQVKQNMPGSILIFIMPPSFEELQRRLRLRETESKEAIAKRLHLAKKEIDAAKIYDYVIVNDEIDKAANRLVKIVEEVHSGR